MEEILETFQMLIPFGSISGKDSTGGLCGYNPGTISNCYSTGLILGENITGGLCGRNSYSISNCYSNSSVLGGDYTGGLCGFNSYGSISDCYSTGLVSANTNTGGFCGENSTGSISNCFWDIETSSQSSSDGGTGQTTLQMQTQSTFIVAGWDFVNEVVNGIHDVWQIGQNGYPEIRYLTDNYQPHQFTGAGTVQNPFLIYDKHDLLGINENIRAYYQLENDINLTNVSFNASVVTVFSGSFNGNKHAITGLKISGSNKQYIGFFGYIGTGGSIQNFGLKEFNISGDKIIGGLCGMNHGIVSNCYSTGSIIGGGDYIGGLCGLNSYGVISNSYSIGSIIGNGDQIGGLCGRNYHGIISDCYSAGLVSGYFSIGGLCGYNYYGNILNCYSTNSISGSIEPGGLCGRNSSGNISNSFWDTETSGQTTSNGGTGKTTAEMQDMNTFVSTGWDFVGESDDGVEDVWYMEPDGYPRLNGVGDDDTGIEVLELIVAARRRVSRTSFEYDVAVKVRNSGVGIESVELDLVGFPANVRILGGGQVTAGAMTSGSERICEGMLTLKIDRAAATDVGKITWHAKRHEQIGGESTEIVTSSMELTTFGAGGIGIAELDEIAMSWMGEGLADVNTDGIVNYTDIGILTGLTR